MLFTIPAKAQSAVCECPAPSPSPPSPAKGEGASALHSLERHARIFRNAGAGWGIEIALWGIIGKACAQAEIHHKLCAPHHGAGGLGFVAHLHLCAAIPNCPFVEVFHDLPGFGSDVFQWYLAEPIRLDPSDGCMAVPDKPGFGVELDEDKIRRYATVDPYSYHPADIKELPHRLGGMLRRIGPRMLLTAAIVGPLGGQLRPQALARHPTPRNPIRDVG